MKIIDVSDTYTYKSNHINGSINIPYDELINNYRKYLKSTYYVPDIVLNTLQIFTILILKPRT